MENGANIFVWDNLESCFEKKKKEIKSKFKSSIFNGRISIMQKSVKTFRFQTSVRYGVFSKSSIVFNAEYCEPKP